MTFRGFGRFAPGMLLVFTVLTLAPAAASAEGTTQTGVAATSQAGRTRLPHTTISKTPAAYSPSSLRAHARWDGKASDCKKQASFTVTNNESTTQVMTINGNSFFTIPKGTTVSICARTTINGQTVVFGLQSNPKAQLSAAFS